MDTNGSQVEARKRYEPQSARRRRNERTLVSGSERIKAQPLFQLGDLACQLGDRCLQNVPDKFQIDTRIIVHDPIAQTGNLRPWNRGVLRLKF